MAQYTDTGGFPIEGVTKGDVTDIHLTSDKVLTYGIHLNSTRAEVLENMGTADGNWDSAIEDWCYDYYRTNFDVHFDLRIFFENNLVTNVFFEVPQMA